MKYDLISEAYLLIEAVDKNSLDRHILAMKILNDFHGYSDSMDNQDEYKKLGKSIYDNLDKSQKKPKTNELIFSHIYNSMNTDSKSKNRIWLYINKFQKEHGTFHSSTFDESKPFANTMDDEDKGHLKTIYSSDNNAEVENSIRHFTNKYNGVLKEAQLRTYINNKTQVPEYAKRHLFRTPAYRICPSLLNADGITVDNIALSHRLKAFDIKGMDTSGSIRQTLRLHDISNTVIRRNSEPKSRQDLLKEWYRVGGNTEHRSIFAQAASKITGHDFGTLPNAYGHYMTHDDVYPEEHQAISDIKNETDNYYRNKLGNDYDNTHITLYRGIIGDHINDNTTYVPSGAESWSSDKSTVRDWTNNWHRYHTYHSSNLVTGHILSTTVSPKDILISYESHEGEIQPESNLRVKKEFVVLGKNINNINREEL